MAKYIFDVEILVTENHRFSINAPDSEQASYLASEYCNNELNAREIVFCSSSPETKGTTP